MSAILGIDAAWTPHHPSGVALIRQTPLGAWECVAVAPSYSSFIQKAGTNACATASASFPALALIEAARALAGTEVVLIAADIPLSKKLICARRTADNGVSSVFGGRGCAAHSPTVDRPGRLSDEIRKSLESFGFKLAIKQADLKARSVIETYPHPALLSLMRASYRLPYKVANSKRYWPDCEIALRRQKIIDTLIQIEERIATVITGVELQTFAESNSFQQLKQTEDMLDALVCAWVGTLALSGGATPLGDDDATIWVPSDAMRPTNWDGLLKGPLASESYMLDVEKLPPQERSFF